MNRLSSMLATGRFAIVAATSLALTVSVLAVVVSGALGKADRSSPSKQPVASKAFHSCAGLVGYAKRYQERAGYGGATTLRPMPTDVPMPMPDRGFDRNAPLPSGAPESSAPNATTDAPDHSTTNVQEAGVDEPDIVKADGSRIFAVAGGKLYAVVLVDGTPHLAGSIDLAANSFDYQLLIEGDRLLVISTDYGTTSVRAPSSNIGAQTPGRPDFAPVIRQSETRIAEIDVSSPDAMKIVNTMSVEGNYVSARQNGSSARIIVSSTPDAVQGAGAVHGASRSTDWLPSYVLRRGEHGHKLQRKAVSCTAVRRASSFSGLDTLTILTVDMTKGLPAVDSVGFMTNADTVYASPTSLYLASQPMTMSRIDDVVETDSDPTTIHKFDISAPDKTVYRASGGVKGSLLNQFSLSEQDGFLRATTTVTPTWSPTDSRTSSESFVTVLKEEAGRLVEVGKVGGLGHGEQIRSVRFVGNAGYVVTFKRTDPLYTVDLSEPTKPVVQGELKLRGYSAYLHPAGDGLLIGIGQDATRSGNTLGTQISLFDVSHPSEPVLLHQQTLAPSSSSEAEYDHHAFLYWPQEQLVVVPADSYAYDANDEPKSFNGAIGFHIGRDGITEVGRVTHGDGASAQQIRRSLVAQGELFTVSDKGLEMGNLSDLGELAWVPFQ